MSLDRTKFSRITVNTDEDDDVVIHAGARPEPEAASADQGVSAEGTLNGTVDEDVPEDGLAEEVPTEGRETVAHAPTECAAAPGAPVDRDPSSRRAVRDTKPVQSKIDYRETTAEDLDSAPMSLMQKIIIVLAALAVVAIIAYIAFVR